MNNNNYGTSNSPRNNVQRRRPSSGTVVRRKAGFRFSYFWFFIFLLVIGSAIILLSARGSVSSFLGEYEEVQPKYVAQQIYDRYFAPINYDALISDATVNYKIGDTEYTNAAVSEFETKDDLLRYVKSLFSAGELSYYSISSGVAGESKGETLKLADLSGYFVRRFNSRGAIRYIVKSGESKIAEFVLDYNGQKSERGFKLYGLSTLSLYFYPHESITVYVPSTAEVTLNGVTVGSGYRLENVYDKTESCNRVPEGVEGLAYVAYYADGMFFEPELKVVDRTGKQLKTTYDADKNLFSAEAEYSPELQAQYADYVINAIKRYAAYMQYDGARRDFIDYFDTESDLWANIISTENYFVLDHSGFSFRDESAGEFYAYSDNVFSCRVSMTHLLHRMGREDYTDYIDFTLYLHRCPDGVFRIYDTQTHTDS